MPIEDPDASTPSEADTSVALDTPSTETEHDPGEVVQRDKEGARKSIKETLRAAVDEHKREPSPARQAAAAQRAREDTGKFAPETKSDKILLAPTKSEAKVEQPAKAAPEAITPSPADKPGEQQPAASTPAVAVPSSWSKEAKDAWASIPPAIQQAVAKREKEVSDGFAQYQARTREIDQAFTPQRRAALQQFGKTEAQAIDQLFGWHEHLSNPQTRAQAFRALAQSHGFDLSTLAQNPGQQQAQPQDPNDPRVFVQQALQGTVSPLDQRLSALEQMLQRQQQSEVEGRIGDFSKDKPHFEKVRVTMGQLIQSGAATNLDDAYQKAVWADPEIRADMLAAEQAKREADAKAAADAAQARAAADAEAKRKADADAAAKARKANVSVRGSTPVGSSLAPRQSNKPLRETLKESIAAASGNRASV